MTPTTPPPVHVSTTDLGCSFVLIAAMLCVTALLGLRCKLDHEREMERIRQESRP